MHTHTDQRHNLWMKNKRRRHRLSPTTMNQNRTQIPLIFLIKMIRGIRKISDEGDNMIHRKISVPFMKEQ